MGYKRKNIRVFERVNDDILSLYNSHGVHLRIGQDTSKGKIEKFEEDKAHTDDIYVHLTGGVFTKFHVDTFTKVDVDSNLMAKSYSRKRLLLLK